MQITLSHFVIFPHISLSYSVDSEIFIFISIFFITSGFAANL